MSDTKQMFNFNSTLNDFGAIKQRQNQIKRNSEEINKIIRNKKFYLKHQLLDAPLNKAKYGTTVAEAN